MFLLFECSSFLTTRTRACRDVSDLAEYRFKPQQLQIYLVGFHTARLTSGVQLHGYPATHTDHTHTNTCARCVQYFIRTPDTSSWSMPSWPRSSRNRGLLPWLSLSETEGINLQGDGMRLERWERKGARDRVCVCEREVKKWLQFNDRNREEWTR